MSIPMDKMQEKSSNGSAVRVDSFRRRIGKSTSSIKKRASEMMPFLTNIPTAIKGFPLWKKAMRLPADPTWYVVINILCVASTCTHIYHASAGICVTLTNVKTGLFVADIFYGVDIILALSTKYVGRQVRISTRPVWMLFLEVLSIFPFEILSTYKEHHERTMYCVLKLNRCLRMIKVYYFFGRYYKHVDDSIYVRIIEMYMNILIIGLTTFMIYCNVHCFLSRCKDFCDFFLIWAIFAKIMIAGTGRYVPQDIVWYYILIYMILLTFFLAFILPTCHIGIENIETIYDKQRFVLLYSYELESLKDSDVPPYIFRSLRNTFALKWRKCGGYNENMSFLRFIPQVMRAEVLLNINWSAFAHSSLFRDQKVAYLRYLASIVRRRFYMPGEYVFRKNEIKKKMIYVVSGTIQLLSEDDGESPILSFCNGTCIGESCLLVSYKSKNHVYCKNFCEVHIIERKDFIRMSVQYPDMYHHFRKIVDRRYEKSKYTKTLADYAKSLISQTQRAKDTYTIIWIKNTLHRLMSTDKESAARHELQNIYLQHDIDTSIFNQMLFCADYLDLLAINERHEAEKDTVFVKTSFPCILQPNSIVKYITEAFIVIITIVVSFLLPHMCFVLEEVPKPYYTIVNTMTFFNWVDIYLQVSTGIYTRHGVISKIPEIIALRARDLCFCCDLISCVPIEIFMPVFVEVVNDQNIARLQLNRLAKLYRVYRLFQQWETKLNFNLVLIRYLKFAWIHAYTVFFLSCVLIHLYPNLDNISVYYHAVQLVTGVGLLQTTFDKAILVFFCMDFVFFFIRLVMYTQIVSAYIITMIDKIQTKIRCSEILVKLKVYKIDAKYTQRARRFLALQNLHIASMMQSKQDYFYLAETPEFIHNDILEFLLSDILQSHVFFQVLPNECLREICSKMKSALLPSNEVIVYAGDMSTKVYIVWVGRYTTYNAEGQHVWLSTGDRIINMLPAMFKGSAALSYVTVTDCKVVSFDIGEFWQILTKYPKQLELVNSTLSASADIGKRMRQFANIEVVTDITPWLEVKEKSFYCFGFHQKPDSYEEFDYYVPFDRLYPFGFIKIFLMRFTIMPNGNFIKVWEALRCVLAIQLALFVFMAPIYWTDITYVILVLDVTAFVDLYVRLHVCYYNEKGILVKHPLKTALHYLSHGFLIDFIAAFPFKYLALTDYKDAGAFFISHGNCLLQLHRYVQFFSVLRNNSVTTTNHAFALVFFPIVLVAANSFGCILIKTECTFNSDLLAENFTRKLYCAPDSVLANSPFKKPIGPWRAYLYGFYIVTGLLTTTGWQGYYILNNTSKIIVAVTSFVGLYCTVLLTAYIVSFYAVGHNFMLEYQEQMRYLKVFMKRINISKKLRKHTIKNCEKHWSLCRGESLNETVQSLHVTLKLDILYEAYGKKAYLSSIFKHKNRNFYRNLLQYGKSYFVLKNEYIYTINELNSYTMILLNGAAEVIGADGVLITTLYPGSLFANLENRSHVRLKNTVIAGTHVELFLIKSKQLYNLLSSYPAMERDFFKLKAANVSYIPSGVHQRYAYEPPTVIKATSIWSIDHVFDPNSRGVQIWKLFILFFTCYLGIMVDFYQLGAGDFSYYILIVQYTSDIFFAIDYLVRDRIGYEDEKGIMVTDKRKIAKRNRKKKVMNVMSLISLIPLDVFVIIYSVKPNLKSLIFGCFRLNRLLRIIYVFDLFKTLSRKLNVNVLGVKAFYVIVWVALFLMGTASLIGICSCLNRMNMHPRTPTCTELYDIGEMNRITIYIRFLYITMNSLTLGSQHNFYPEGGIMIALFSFVMLIGHQLRGICLGQIFATVFEKHSNKYLYRSVLRRVKYFIKSEDLSTSLEGRVESHMRSLWRSYEAVVDPILLRDRPTYLKDAILNDALYHDMRKHPLFKHCHTDCLRQIVQHVKFQPYFKGGYVQLEQARDERMYMLISGKVAVIADVYRNVNEFLEVLQKGAFFGVLAGFYPRMAHKYTYRSIVHNSYVAYLERKDWIHIVNFFPASKELMHEAARNYVGY